MPTELENSIRAAAEKIAKYVEDVATLTVETRYVEIGADATPDFEHAHPVAKTIIRLDGDSSGVVPMVKGQNEQYEVDRSLFELHERNVNTAIEYRARIISALWGALQARGR